MNLLTCKQYPILQAGFVLPRNK